MVRATSIEVYNALITGGFTTLAIVDDLNDTCYFTATVSDAAVRVILDPLEWTATTITILSDLDPADPYPQYLNTTRHDQVIRHLIPDVVPRDTTKADVDHTHEESDVLFLVTDLAAKAPLASPTFTGTPAAPTADAGTDTTQIATTAFVQNAVSTAEDDAFMYALLFGE